MAFTKIENADLNGIGVIGLPDQPGLSTAAMLSFCAIKRRSSSDGWLYQLKPITTKAIRIKPVIVFLSICYNC